MDLEQFTELFFSKIPYRPTERQALVVKALARFCSLAVPGESVFMLNGYAGTGKTSIIGALVESLSAIRIPVVLMAPTGRAAKVFSAMSHRPAYTIHRRIYHVDSRGGMTLSPNQVPGTVFIVDEASMIGDDRPGGVGSSLLDDLMTFCFTADDCKLILMGDTAQLPPVGLDTSPAMDVDRLRGMGLRVSRAVMTDVARQRLDSGILRQATWLRRAMLVDPLPEPKLFVGGSHKDVVAVSSEELPDYLTSSYSDAGIADTILITRSNKRATGFNLAIRSQILDYSEELVKGDRLLVAKNNYHWSAQVKGLDFVANGDIAVVDRIISTEHRYGFRWADVSLVLPDRDVTLDCKIVLDPLTTDYPAMTVEAMDMLIQARMADADSALHAAGSESGMRRAMRSDPYINAIQVKYGYAVTCHKAQGGQWSDVYIDMGYIPPEAMGLEFYRWLYTATTRARSRLYYIS